MIKVAICDDSYESRLETKQNVVKNPFFQENVSIFMCASAEELIEAYVNGNRYDIVFLDVEMGNMNGINAGKQIRCFDKNVILVFVSNYPKYAISAYECEAFYFIVKPIQQNHFHDVLCKVIEKYKMMHQFYILQSKGNMFKIELREIIYFEVYRKHLIFHTTSGIYEIRGKMSEEYAKLKMQGFCQVHQGYCVNMNHIKAVSGHDLILDNDETIMISVRKKTEVMRIYAEFLEETL